MMNDQQELYQKVKFLISMNQTDKALELLAKEQLSALDRQVIMLNNRYNKIKDDQRLGIIDNESAQIEFNKINHSLLDLAELISKKPKDIFSSSDLSRKSYTGNLPVLIGAGILGIVLLAFAWYHLKGKPDVVPGQTEKEQSQYAHVLKQADSLYDNRDFENALRKYEEIFELKMENKMDIAKKIIACQTEIEARKQSDEKTGSNQDGETRKDDERGTDEDKKTEKNNPAPPAASINWKVDAATSWSSDKAYFFDGSQYSRFEVKTADINSDYPLAIRDNFAGGWPSNWTSIDAAAHIGSEKVYCFRGNQYLRYDTKTGKVDKRPMAINVDFAENWPPDWTSVDAAVNLDNGNIYFFRGRNYIRYEINTRKVTDPTPIAGNFAGGWPGWPNVDAAVNYGDGNAYFFRGDEYFVYKIKGGTCSKPQKVVGNFVYRG